PVITQVNSSAGCCLNDRESPGRDPPDRTGRARREVLDALAARRPGGTGPGQVAVSPYRGWETARTCPARSSPHREDGGAGAAPRYGHGRPGAPEHAGPARRA